MLKAYCVSAAVLGTALAATPAMGTIMIDPDVHLLFRSPALSALSSDASVSVRVTHVVAKSPSIPGLSLCLVSEPNG